MIYDRPYMRHQDEPRREFPVLKWIIFANIGVFIFQCILLRWVNSPTPYIAFLKYFALTGEGFTKGYLWTPLTYSLLHSTNMLFHIFGNLLGIFFLGRALQPVLGSQRLLALYIASAVMGGLFWLVFNFRGGLVMGASAAVLGYLAVFCLLYPNRRVQFLLFFVIPITIQPKYIGWGSLAINLFGFLFNEISPNGQGSGVAYSAHLGGMLCGWLFYKFVHNRGPIFASGTPAVELPNWVKKKRESPPQETKFTINISNRKQLKREVDRILDKINNKGFGSLSEEEKRTLDSAKDILSR